MTKRRKKPARPKLPEWLFGSVTRARLLALFLTNPAKEFYARQLARETRLALYTVQQELAHFARWGIFGARRQGRETLYRVNEDNPLYQDLKNIVYKTVAFGDVVGRALVSIEGVSAAFIYGSVAKGGESATSDIDLFILGKPDQTRLAVVLREAEQRLGREINLVLMEPEEWQRRRRAGGGFISELLKSPKIFLVGDEQSLR